MKKVYLLLFPFFYVIISFAGVQNGVYNVQEFGVKAIKDSVSTKKIQKIIDACAKAGGGTIYFAPGNYTSGQLVMKDNIKLYFESGATLFASQNPNDFKQVANYQADNQELTPNETCLIFADGIKNFSIEGKGTIHGQAKREIDEMRSVDKFINTEIEIAKEAGVSLRRYYVIEPKVRLILINNSTNITIKDVSILESPDWNLHLGNCNHVNISGIYLFSSLEEGVNSDGIDIDGCQNVHISNCTVNTGDDAICLKSTNKNGKYSNCENITVTNCTLISTSTGLKLGTESHGDFKHILFQNCTIKNTNRGFSIVVRDGANVSDIIFSNLTIECNRKHYNWWGNGDAFWIVLLKRKEDSRIGSIKNIIIKDIIARNQGTCKMEGFEGKELENISISNVQLTIESEGKPDKRATDIFYAKNIKGLNLNNVSLNWDEGKGIEKKWQQAINLDNVSNLRLTNINTNQVSKSLYPIFNFNNVSNAIIENCLINQKNKIFIQVTGLKSVNIILNDNYLHNIEIPFVLEKGLSKKIIDFRK